MSGHFLVLLTISNHGLIYFGNFKLQKLTQLESLQQFTFKGESLQENLLVGQSHQKYSYTATRCGLVRCHFATSIGMLTIQPFCLMWRTY